MKHCKRAAVWLYVFILLQSAQKAPLPWKEGRLRNIVWTEMMSLMQLKCIIFGVDLQGNLRVLFGIQGDDEMKARKLKSGSWRCQVYSHTEQIRQPDGSTKERRVYKSFTCKDPSQNGKRKCEQMAAQWALERESAARGMLTFEQAVEQYIASRQNVLSPRTIMDYRATQRNHLDLLLPRNIYDITQAEIQEAINQEAAIVSPKTIRNIHGLISAVMRVYRPDFALNTALPKRRPSNLYIPTEDDIKTLLGVVNGTEMEIPVMLGAFCTMRRGEICALESSDIEGNTIHVSKNMIKDGNGNWIVKTPKSYAGDRYVYAPPFVINKLKGRTGRITNMNPNTITSMFIHYHKRSGLPHFRFHDLRHYSASMQHALGIPDSYIMQRGGWGNDTTLKTVYRHALSDQTKAMSEIANNYFEGLYDATRNATQK